MNPIAAISTNEAIASVQRRAAAYAPTAAPRQTIHQGRSWSRSRSVTRGVLVPLRHLLQDLPWWIVCLGAAVGAYSAARSWTLANDSFVLIAAIGFMGQWENAMDT